jgi:O-antigen/teichoic acid export membrane protein
MSLKITTVTNYVARFYSMMIGIVMYPLYLHYLGAEAYGLVGFFTMFHSWLSLLDMGLSPTLTRESARLKHNPEKFLEFRKLLRSIESIFLLIALIIGACVFGASNWIAANWLNVEKIPLATVAFCISLMGIMTGIRWFVSLYSGSIIGMEKQVWFNTYLIILASIRSLGAFFLVKYVSPEPQHFFIYQLIVAVFEFAIIHWKLYNLMPAVQDRVSPSLEAIRKILPFALSIAGTSGIWLIVSQIDKLLLSHFLTLKEYGYFAMVVTLSNSMMQLATPISQILLPRMTALLAQGKEEEMLEIYNKGTQLVSVLMCAVSGCIAVFSWDLLYVWTRNIEAADWAAPLVFWYALSATAVALSSFQYYLQYSHGKLKYHVRGSIFFGVIQVISLCYAVYNYKALGAAIVWFSIQTFGLVVWTWFIHNKFAPGLHRKWLMTGLVPPMMATTIMCLFYKWLNINFVPFSRLESILIFISLGLVVLGLNAILTPYTRNVITSFFFRGKEWKSEA